MKQSLTPHNSKQRILARLFAGLLSFIFALGLMAAPAKATGVYDLPSLGGRVVNLGGRFGRGYQPCQ